MPGTCYINGRFLSQEATGVQRYAEELIKTLDAKINTGEIDTGSITILAPRKLNHTLNLKNISLRRVGRFSGHLWEQLELPRFARGRLLISLCNTAPLIKRNQIVTIHDAGFRAVPESYSLAFRMWYRFLLYGLGKIVRHVITVSQFSRDELEQRVGIASSKIKPIHHGSEHIASVESDDHIIERAGLIGGRFLLAVSSFSPRKNFQAVASAIDLLEDSDFDTVIAGGANPKVFANSTLESSKRVHRLGYVTDGELKSLYSHAAAFIYPSLYEGFGLPPLEAMSCGCPVIVSDIPPHREVCGEAAIYCDPNNIEDIAEKIGLVMSDSGLRQKLIAAGKIRAGKFSWAKSAAEFYDVVKELNAF